MSRHAAVARRALLGSSLAVVLAGCGAGAESPAPASTEPAAPLAAGLAQPSDDYETLTVTFPRGEADAGREAFLDLQCSVCHAVAGEPELPEPWGDFQGPRLDGTMAERPRGYVLTSLMAPSHAISVATGADTRARGAAGMASPMADYRPVMSVGQMLDLLAFLTTLEQP